MNPIRAALVETIDESDFTSAQKRAAELVARSGDRPEQYDVPPLIRPVGHLLPRIGGEGTKRESSPGSGGTAWRIEYDRSLCK